VARTHAGRRPPRPTAKPGNALGASNVSAVPLQRLGGDDRFAPSHLVGKLANICGDVGPNSARDMSLFKQMTDNDPIYAERKGRDGFEFCSAAVPVSSANEFPRCTEALPLRLASLRWECCQVPRRQEVADGIEQMWMAVEPMPERGDHLFKQLLGRSSRPSASLVPLAA
jgi:hypothetical protein